jgi:hypothetical protein
MPLTVACGTGDRTAVARLFVDDIVAAQWP